MKRLLFSYSLVVALLAASAIGSPSLATVNLFANPGFEDGGGSYSGWDVFGSGPELSLPEGDDIIRTGVAASKIFGEFLPTCGGASVAVGGYFQSFTPTPGTSYELSGFSYVSSADPIPDTLDCFENRLIAKIVFFNAAVGGSEISSNEVIIGDANSVLDTWVDFSVSAPVPAGALRAQAMFLFLQPRCNTGAVYVDDVSFCEFIPPVPPNILVNPSFSAALTGWSSFGNASANAQSFAVRTPPGSAKLFSTFDPDFNTGIFQKFLAAPGSVWRLDLYAMTTCAQGDVIADTSDNIVVASIVFRNSAGDSIGVNPVSGEVLNNKSPLGTWTRHTIFSGPAPAGTDSVDAVIVFISPSQLGGSAYIDDVSFSQLSTTGVGPNPTPVSFSLRQSVPNPFRSSTRIDFELIRGDVVDVSVFDIAGRLVTRLLQGRLEEGPHSVDWNGTRSDGTRVATGIYRYVLRTSNGLSSRSVVLID